MGTVLLKSLGFIVIILTGFFSVRLGLVSREDGKRLGRIVINITLPCTVIMSFISVSLSFSLFIAFLIGFIYNSLALLVSCFVTFRRSCPEERASAMLCCNSLNVGSFALPFCQSFFPIAAVGYLAMLDVSNCVMSLGVGPAAARSIAARGERFGLASFFRKLLRNVPLDVYLACAAISLLHIEIPEVIVPVIGPIAQANGFLAMFMIGTQLDLDIDMSEVRAVVKIFITRFLVAAFIIAYLYFTSYDPLMKRAIAICLLAPPTSLTVVLVHSLGCDTKTAAMVSSLSIPVSIAIYLAMMIALA